MVHVKMFGIKILQKVLSVTKVAASRNFPNLPIRLVHSEPKEVSIPVPWGHIAGRLWNDGEGKTPFICIHGWKDNSASFDKLIPMILGDTNKFQFLSIDLPGHGFSSHYPPGMLYQMIDVMIALRRVVRHFGWKEKDGIHIIGHSLGAILSFIFAASHPSLVHCLIAIDALVPITFSKADAVKMIRHTSESFLQLESEEMVKIQHATHDKDDLLKRMSESHMMGSQLLTCKTLLTRAIIEDPQGSGKYRFSHDPRVHFLPLMGFSEGQIEYMARSFRSRLLHIKAENGVSYLSGSMQNQMKEWLEENNKKLVQFTTAKKASHHVHIVQPEIIITDVLDFLSSSH